jgi:hypothetical protein
MCPVCLLWLGEIPHRHIELIEKDEIHEVQCK